MTGPVPAAVRAVRGIAGLIDRADAGAVFMLLVTALLAGGFSLAGTETLLEFARRATNGGADFHAVASTSLAPLVGLGLRAAAALQLADLLASDIRRQAGGTNAS